MKKLKIYIFLAFIFFILSPLFFFIGCFLKLLTFPFDKKGVVLHYAYGIWGHLSLFFLPKCRGVDVIGFDKIDPSKKYVIVANHQSQLDILIGFTLRFPFKWVSKKEVFNVPFIGWGMTLNNYIPIQRGDLHGVKEMLKACSKALQNNHSIFIFPEGTRTKNGEMIPFKTGAFTIALENKTDILPIVIRNTGKLLPTGTLIMHEPIKVELEILNPIPYKSFKTKNSKQLASEVQAIIGSRL